MGAESSWVESSQCKGPEEVWSRVSQEESKRWNQRWRAEAQVM